MVVDREGAMTSTKLRAREELQREVAWMAAANRPVSANDVLAEFGHEFEHPVESTQSAYHLSHRPPRRCP